MNDKKRKSVFMDLYYQPYRNKFFKLSTHAKDDHDMVQRLGLMKKLQVHQGCVNTICWNSTGEYILSGSDDQHLVITNGHTYKVEENYCTSHHANIFSAKFLPCSNDKQIISCSGDGIILHTDLENAQKTHYNQFSCHAGTTYEVVTIPDDPNTFLSCGEDGTVRWFDLRTKTSCRKPRCKDDILISCQRAITALNVNPLSPHQLSIGCADSTVRIYDRRCLTTNPEEHSKAKAFCSFIPPNLQNGRYRITSLSYSLDGQDMLVSYSSDYLYLFKVKNEGLQELSKTIPRQSAWAKVKMLRNRIRTDRSADHSPPPVRRLRLRGDWSDTGPNARPERDANATENNNINQARPHLHATLMQRMTDVLSQMLNDPMTRAALNGSGGGRGTAGAGGRGGGAEGELANGGSTEESAAADSRSESRRGSHQDNVSSSSSTPSASPMPSNAAPGGISSTDADNTNDNNNSEPTADGGPSVDVPQSTADGPGASGTENTFVELVTAATPSTSRQDGSGSGGSSSTTGRQSSTMVNSLYSQLNTLRNLRDGFIEQHGSEPSVSFKFAQHSTANAFIKLNNCGGGGRGSSTSNLRSGGNDAAAAAGTTSAAVTSSSYSRGGAEAPLASQSTPQEQQQPGPDQSDLSQQNESTSEMEFDYDDEDVDVDDEDSSSEPAFPKKKVDESGVTQAEMKTKYVGHRNARTMIKEATFWGNDHVMSGSDCGHVFVWDRDTAELRMLLQADSHVVNCLQPHPTLPLLATSGIDHDIKLWAPILEEPSFNRERADDLIHRNAIMLEETRDTITVPAAFMIRMLACLNQIRRGAYRRRSEHNNNS